MKSFNRQVALALVAFFVMVGAFAVFSQTTTTVPAVYDGQTLMGSKLRAAFTAICAAIDTKPDKTQAVLTKYATDVVATDPITLPGNTSFVRIDATTVTSTPTISISTTNSIEGQILYVYNGNASATDGIATISSGKMAQFFYASGAWRLISDE